MKETFYFSHDYNARTDPNIKRLLSKYGMFGYGIFWSIIEDLYNNANALRTDYECIAYDLRTEFETIKSIVNDFDLFVVENEIIKSESVGRRLSERISKKEKARESANYRWNNTERNANALQSQSDSNAIKESKGKESKGKDIYNRPNFEKLKNRIYLEAIFSAKVTSQKRRISFDQFSGMVDDFILTQIANQKAYKNEIEMKDHFTNWITIQINNHRPAPKATAF